MTIQFRKATKTQSRLRLSIAGPAGSGKTYTALKITTEMKNIIGGKIAVIDTERGSASKYSDIFEFDVIELDDFHPERYVEAIQAAEKAGYNFLIIDSTTHEWNGKNGILELHEAAIQRQRTKNSYTAWADVTPLHNKFVDAILQSKCHIIASVRSKTDHVQETVNGRTEVRKVGMASIQREGMDYEYDIQIEMSVDHVGVVTKTRCAVLDGYTKKKPGADLAETLVAWLTDGAPEPEKKEEPAPPAQVSAETLAEIQALWPKYGQKLGGKVVTFADYLHQKKGISDPKWMTQEEAVKMLGWLQDKQRAATPQPTAPPAAQAAVAEAQDAPSDAEAPAAEAPTTEPEPAQEVQTVSV